MAPEQVDALVLVTDVEQLRSSVSAFVDALSRDWPQAALLAASTTYWVWDPVDEWFAPSKFAGYVGMTESRYEAALRGETVGAGFDGFVARNAIEAVIGHAFHPLDALAERLVSWADAEIREGVFQTVNTRKWCFLSLPSLPASSGAPRRFGVPR